MAFGSGRAWIGLCVAATLMATPAAAQTNGLSDKLVQTLMSETWGTLPTKFRHPNGEIITIDKTKKDSAIVPVDKARMVIAVADRSARAQYCGLYEQQDANFQTMMQREVASGLWSKQQLVFMTMLHATTVAYMTGKFEFKFGEEGQKDREVVTKGPLWTAPCTDENRAAINARIMAYINETPAPAGKRAEPSQTTKKK